MRSVVWSGRRTHRAACATRTRTVRPTGAKEAISGAVAAVNRSVLMGSRPQAAPSAGTITFARAVMVFAASAAARDARLTERSARRTATANPGGATGRSLLRVKEVAPESDPAVRRRMGLLHCGTTTSARLAKVYAEFVVALDIPQTEANAQRTVIANPGGATGRFLWHAQRSVPQSDQMETRRTRSALACGTTTSVSLVLGHAEHVENWRLECPAGQSRTVRAVLVDLTGRVCPRAAKACAWTRRRTGSLFRVWEGRSFSVATHPGMITRSAFLGTVSAVCVAPPVANKAPLVRAQVIASRVSAARTESR